MDKKYAEEELLRRKFLEGEGRLLILSLTRRCNLHCLYCRGDRSDWYDRLSKNSQSTDYKQIHWSSLADFCREHRIVEILLSGGEPLAYPYLIEFMGFLKDNDLGFAIHTNGVHRQWGRVLKWLRMKNLRPNIALSLELFDPLQKTLRGTGTPHALLEELVAAGFAVELKVTLHRLLLPYLPEVRERLLFWRDKGVKSVRFQPVVPVSQEQRQRLALDESCAVFMDELIRFKTHDPVPGDLLRNSVEGLETIRSLLLKGRVAPETARSCIVKDKILFLNTDNKPLNCVSLWQRESIQCTADNFDYVCCGYKA